MTDRLRLNAPIWPPYEWPTCSSVKNGTDHPDPVARIAKWWDHNQASRESRSPVIVQDDFGSYYFGSFVMSLPIAMLISIESAEVRCC